MSKMKNWMMDIEEFCDGHFYGGDGVGYTEYTIEEVSENAGKYFGASMAKNYAASYLTRALGEI